MDRVEFQIEVDDLIRAYRLNLMDNFRLKRAWKKYAQGLAAVIIAIAFVSWAWDNIPFWMLPLLGLAYWAFILSFCYVGLYLIIPSRSRTIYKQHKMLHEEVVLEWSDSEIIISTKNSHARLLWSDYIGIIHNQNIILLKQSDVLLNIIPTHALTEDQKASLLQKRNQMEG